MDIINDYLKRTKKLEDGRQVVRPRVQCADGFTISVQANSYAYCKPRIDEADEYSEVELGFPNEEDSLILDYAEDPYVPTETVYGFVPVELVNELIEKHGGIIN